MKELPLVSIITPSYNQGKYIEDTIESILSQDYPHIEHVVVDGASTDGTLKLLKRYSRSLGERFRYISEIDRGQSHAINKGLQMAKGEIIGWLNSDDTYLPGAIPKAIDALLKNPNWGMVYGGAYYTDEINQVINPYPSKSFSKQNLFEYCMICQPAGFIRKSVFENVGGVDESLNFCMDYELWMRIAKEYDIGYINEFLANSRLQPDSKTVLRSVEIGLPEIFRTSLKHYGEVSNYWVQGFIGNHYAKGESWIINQLKPYFIFGHTPRTVHTNLYPDNWAPPHLGISLKVDLHHPLEMIVIKGNHAIPGLLNRNSNMGLSVYLNSKFIKTHIVKPGPFLLEIPIFSNEDDTVIDVVAHDHFIPSQVGLNEDQRTLSFLVDEVVPLSEEEAKFFHVLQKGLGYVEPWLKENRKTKGLLR